MKKLLFLFLLYFPLHTYAQMANCINHESYTLVYQSNDGAGNCTFSFTPTITVRQPSRLIAYTFTSGATSVSVCYSGNPIALVNCSGPFTSLPVNTTLAVTLPAATVDIPCSNVTISLRGSNAANGAATCRLQQVYNGPLPVSLLSFYGSSNPAGVVLNWATEWEKDNESFSVQKSLNAKSFESIGNVKGKQTTNQVSSYEFIDTDVVPDQVYYYRLKQNDVNGHEDYSRIISVRHQPGQEALPKIFPNSNVGGSFSLSAPNAESAVLKLYNQAGIEIPIIVNKTGDVNLVSVAAKAHIPTGIYILKIFDAKGSEQNALKVLVQ
ncbi:T9SS type A sorting domain-containing protein [Spirosoma terrae]|uniref:T9SS type A sorting domain-containing protein n=1 Tax=Spirosoma terrae TaxID=1968276 RepID=A0A6L9LEW2_9BACT|nr:T9SS type A sorting domain-containing protein [Spirosoma terrae]NDU98207.1 T9SS type A sorting domain-containing protein [Spirosoma terrae]